MGALNTTATDGSVVEYEYGWNEFTDTFYMIRSDAKGIPAMTFVTGRLNIRKNPETGQGLGYEVENWSSIMETASPSAKEWWQNLLDDLGNPPYFSRITTGNEIQTRVLAAVGGGR